ncbi:hypothetical protein D5085_12390 [Ectothiorhodospiraceae bacterium BW-2]|nr:hypothetical protein D5085_12390 [Ectothiorhodospiraceae bacterium BW-2]
MESSNDTYTITHWLDQLNASTSASEFHGLLTGLIITQGNKAAVQWQPYITPDLNPGDLVREEAVDNLNIVFESLIEELNDPMLSFSPLMPEEGDASIEQRIEAISEWTQGLLLGLSHGNLAVEKLSAESGEFLDDLLEISRANTFVPDSNEEINDRSLTEIGEYLRAGALTLLDELHPLPLFSVADDTPTLH